MNIYSLPAIISFTVNFSIAFIVLMEKPKATLNRWFAVFIFSFAIWNLAEILILNSANRLPALLGAQILYRIIFFAPAFYVIIAYLFPRSFHKFATNPVFYIGVFSLPIIALSLSFPDFQIELVDLIETPRIYHYHFTFNFKPVFLISGFVSIGYIVWGSVVLWRKIRHLRTIRLKNQTWFFLIGMVIIFIGFITIILIKSGIRNPASFYFLSTIFTFAVAIFFFMAVVRFHLFKAGMLLSRGVTYTVLSALTLAIYFFVIRAASVSVKSWIGINSSVFDAFLIVSLILIILPFEKRLRNLFDRWLNKDLQQYRKNILILFRELQAYYEKDAFFKIITRFIGDNFKSSAVYVFNYDHASCRFVEMSGGEDMALFIPENSSIIRQLKQREGAVEFYELNHNQLSIECRRFFEDVHARFFLPLMYEDKLLGIVVLCRKKYGLEYNENEREILSILASEIAASFHRNEIIEEMREKDKRRFQIEKLAAIGQLTASVAHEIRNPLNTISISAETLLQKYISKEDESNLKQYIIEESNRLNRVLTDFLSFTRVKPAVDSEIDIENMFERLRLELQSSEALEIPITYEIDAVKDTLVSDPNLLFQVLLNLGLNARAAIKERCSSEKQFTCEQGMIKCTMASNKNHFVFSVTDNGVGILPENGDRIYDPFFTTKEDGTGLGLSIVRQIIEVLSGSIEFTSQPGHTCFNIYLAKQVVK
jgi:signal transduction histidine kinase